MKFVVPETTNATKKAVAKKSTTAFQFQTKKTLQY